MNTVIFDTEEDAQPQLALDLIKYREDHPEIITEAWSKAKERNDGRWDYKCYPNQDYTGLTVEPYSKDNYPTVDAPL